MYLCRRSVDHHTLKYINFSLPNVTATVNVHPEVTGQGPLDDLHIL